MIMTMIRLRQSCQQGWNWHMMGCVVIFWSNYLIAPNIIRVKFLLLGLLLIGWAALAPLSATEAGTSVVVVYNSKMAESKEVAEYYAKRRQVPSNQVFGFELPVTESMTRLEYL